MAGGTGGADSGEPEFQIAPMIDVLLVMLVFFMIITSAQVLKVDKNIKLPVAPDAQKKENARAECIVNIRWIPEKKTAQYVFQGNGYDKPEQLIPLLKNAKAVGEKQITSNKNPTFRAVIRGDKDLPSKYVSYAMNSCAKAGIIDIAFATVNKQ